MTTITRWWQLRSGAERLDLYTRGPLYGISALEPLLVLGVLTGQRLDGTAPATALLALTGFHTVTCLAVLHRGLRHVAPGGPRPGRGLLALLTVLTAVGAATAAVLLLEDAAPGEAVPAWLATGQIFLLAAVAAVVPLLRPLQLAALVVGPSATATVTAVVLGRGDLVPAVVTTFVWTATVAASYRGSIWFLGVLQELDRARTTEARLAVAEERLRFARDLHDVLGRNLVLIRVHGDLAAQLLRRGQDGALDHLDTLHRTVGDSMRDLREVVGGYRAADLDTELAGARSVLGAAGIPARVTGSGADLPRDVQVALGWVVREAVTNILRHAEPTAVGIRLDAIGPGADGPGHAVLRVENDGARHRPEGAGPGTGPRAAGAGLAGLRERLHRVGGGLDVEHEADGSFRLRARLPLAPEVVR